MSGFVYAIADGHGRVKIGWSADPLRRLSKLKSDNGSECKLLGGVPSTAEQERELQQLLSEWRVCGKWFDASARPVALFLSFLRPIATPSVDDPSASPLKRWRKANGVTLVSLASRVGVGQPTLSKIERGEGSPSLALAGRISIATGGVVTPNDFIPRP